MTPELTVPGAPAPQPVLLPIRDAKSVAVRFFAMPGLFIHPEVGLSSPLLPLNGEALHPTTAEVHWVKAERDMWQSEYTFFFKVILAKLHALKVDCAAKDA